MLGLILIYWVGKAFYDLAEKHERTGWGHAILGVAMYYVIQMVFAFVCFVIIDANASSYTAIDDSEMAITLISIPISALGCWGYYTFLKNRWNRSAKTTVGFGDEDVLLDDDLILSDELLVDPT